MSTIGAIHQRGSVICHEDWIMNTSEPPEQVAIPVVSALFSQALPTVNVLDIFSYMTTKDLALNCCLVNRCIHALLKKTHVYTRHAELVGYEESPELRKKRTILGDVGDKDFVRDVQVLDTHIEGLREAIGSCRNSTFSWRFVYSNNSRWKARIACEKTLFNLQKMPQTDLDEALVLSILKSTNAFTKLLIRFKANPMSQKTAGGDAPFHSAAQFGDLQAVSLALDQREDSVNIQGAYGNTSLNYVCRRKDIKIHAIVQALLLAKADVNIENTQSCFATPLCNAVYIGNRDVVALLLQHKAKIHNVDKSQSPFLVACRSRYPNVEVVRLLIEKKADPFECSFFNHEADPFERSFYNHKSALQICFQNRDERRSRKMERRAIIDLISSHYTEESLVKEFQKIMNSEMRIA